MSTTSPEPSRRQRVQQHGFTMVSVIFILVVLAALGAAMARFSQRQHLGSAAELNAARAYQAAFAGLEWASFQVLRNPAPPGVAPVCPGNTNISLGDFVVTVSCSRVDGVDGASNPVFYQLVANACNAPTANACPGSGTPAPTYAERQLSRMVVRP
ncbi:pilus assembly FimT family protein [Paucibacter soli]|uniref:pilus assembly FimT family protein n=1 Tax=Paucibacter soli TaxID=3133433 RepID=UPI003097F466